MTRFARLALVLTTAGVFLVSAGSAPAHKWGNWHWNRYGSSVTINVYNYATYRSQASAAVSDWSSNTILYLPQVGSHTDISLFDGNYGNTGWGGLAEIVNYSGSHILHGHARLNYYYSYSSNMKRGIFCQEVGHLFGLDHSNDGCMGLGYYNNLYYTVAHNWNDIYSMYRYTHHSPGPGEEGGSPGNTVQAIWRHNPDSVREAYQLARVAVRAKVTAVGRADDLTVPATGEPGGVDRLPTQTITLAVGDVLKGRIGEVFQLFRTGSESLALSGDPAYEVGQEYFLFLLRRDDGQYIPVSPEGRYAVTASGIHPVSERPEFAALDGTSVKDFRALLRG